MVNELHLAVASEPRAGIVHRPEGACACQRSLLVGEPPCPGPRRRPQQRVAGAPRQQARDQGQQDVRAEGAHGRRLDRYALARDGNQAAGSPRRGFRVLGAASVTS
jgi:hypothetical protein